jgi:hypothetical protein
MNISNSEYEKPRSVFQLCEWINSKLRNLKQDPAFEELYSERRGKNIKKLLEEAVPSARLGLYLWRPWRDVSSERNLICRCSCRLRTDCLPGRKFNSTLDWE